MGDRRRRWRATTQALDRSSARPTDRPKERTAEHLPSPSSLSLPLPSPRPHTGSRVVLHQFLPTLAHSLNRRSPIGFGRSSLSLYASSYVATSIVEVI